MRGESEATTSIIKIPSGGGVCSSHGLCPTHPPPSPSINTHFSHGHGRHCKHPENPLSFFHFRQAFYLPTMSTCGNCDCSDKSQCVKKGNGYNIDIVETEQSYVETIVMEVAEHDGKCKCGPSCACTNCTCGH